MEATYIPRTQSIQATKVVGLDRQDQPDGVKAYIVDTPSGTEVLDAHVFERFFRPVDGDAPAPGGPGTGEQGPAKREPSSRGNGPADRLPPLHKRGRKAKAESAATSGTPAVARKPSTRNESGAIAPAGALGDRVEDRILAELRKGPRTSGQLISILGFHDRASSIYTTVSKMAGELKIVSRNDESDGLRKYFLLAEGSAQ